MDDLTEARRDLAALQARYDKDVSWLEQELAVALADREEREERALWAESCFGAFDGMTSMSGVLFALLDSTRGALLGAALGLAVASGIGMAAGEYVGDTRTEGAGKRALVMGVSTVVGTLAPVTPFFFIHSKVTALIVAGIIALVMTYAIGKVRHRGVAGYLVTYAILAGAIVATVLVSLGAPGSAA
jgi:VIT1/CCC1 family predicted Fe2+/Mn2+ transporter